MKINLDLKHSHINRYSFNVEKDNKNYKVSISPCSYDSVFLNDKDITGTKKGNIILSSVENYFFNHYSMIRKIILEK